MNNSRKRSGGAGGSAAFDEAGILSAADTRDCGLLCGGLIDRTASSRGLDGSTRHPGHPALNLACPAATFSALVL